MTRINFLLPVAVSMSISISGLLVGNPNHLDWQAAAITEARYKLEVVEVGGSVDYKAGSSPTRPVSIGDLLQTVGDRIITHNQSRAVLRLNQSIARVNLAENSELVLRDFKITSGGGMIAQLALNNGQAQFQVPKFKNSESSLQISVPAGTIAVPNGANFSLNIAPNGAATVAAWDGSLVVRSGNRSVTLLKGFYTFIAPGIAPAAPMLLSPPKV